MGIAWLWYYTHSLSPETMETENEKRAFALYARWRSIRRWASRLYDRYRTFHQKRSERCALLDLPDYLLRDIGMFSTGTEVKVEVVRPIGQSLNIISRIRKTGTDESAAVPDLHAVLDVPVCSTKTESSKAA